MEKLLISRNLDPENTVNDHAKLKAFHARFQSSGDAKLEKIHVENVNMNGRKYKGKSIRLVPC